MIKLLSQWSKTAGILGSVLLSSAVVGSSAALALPEEQVLKKLDSVPVFTIADEQGAPLVREVENEGKIAGVFISQSDANKVVEEIKKNNPDLAKKVNVVPVSLGEIYKLSTTAESQEAALNFIYQPEAEAVTSAKEIGEANQQPYQGGVPLFVAKGGEEGGYLTIEKDSQQVIPFFFDKKQLEELVSKFKEQKPEDAANVDIEVVPLEGVIETLKTSQDKMLEKIVLVPTAESLQFVQGTGQAPAPGAAPTPAPITPEAAPVTPEAAPAE